MDWPGLWTRREFLRVTVPSAACLATASAQPAAAQSASDGAHRLIVGDLKVAIISDGHLVQQTAMFGTDRGEGDRVAALGGVDRVTAGVNVTLVRTKTDLVLIDCGSGPNFVDTTGRLGDRLSAAGVDPKAVTLVVLTHGHPDHLWGAVDEFDDRPRFPNAHYVLSEAEWALWMTGDPTAKVPAERLNFVPGAERCLKVLKDRLTLVKSSADIAPGLQAIDAAGHSQGHIAVALTSGSESAIVLADTLIHPNVSFAHPEWKLGADHEPDRAVLTRKTLLDRVATDRTRVIGYHLPFPGVGIVERRGTAYRFVAAA